MIELWSVAKLTKVSVAATESVEEVVYACTIDVAVATCTNSLVDIPDESVLCDGTSVAVLEVFK